MPGAGGGSPPGRSQPGGVDIVAAVPSAVTDDRGRRPSRRCGRDLLTYFGLPFYRAMIERSGFAADIERLRRRRRRPRRRCRKRSPTASSKSYLAVGSDEQVRAGDRALPARPAPPRPASARSPAPTSRPPCARLPARSATGCRPACALSLRRPLRGGNESRQARATEGYEQMIVLLVFAHSRRGRHGPVAVRAAGAAGAAVGRRRRRPPAAAGHRDRPVGHLHGHDRRAGQAWSTASASAATRCATSRSSCCSSSGWRCWCPALAARLEAPLSRLARFGPRTTRRRLPLGPARRRRARLRLHALRQADPRGGHLRQRRLRAKRSLSAIAYAAGSARRAARAHARRPEAVRPRAPGRPRSDAAARAGRDHDRHGGRDRHQPRRQLRPVRRRSTSPTST